MILIVKVAFLPLPSVASAVILTVLPPAFLFKVTTPFLSTVASLLLLVVHFNVLLVAFCGLIRVVNFIFLPAAIFVEIAEKLILFTLICCGSAFDDAVVPELGVGAGIGCSVGVGVGRGVGSGGVSQSLCKPSN